MPQLKQIEAVIELGTSNTKLKEYGARYSDGHVEAFVAVPDTDMPFSIHITTKGYIAPGISFFVFMDGEYQCNRNKIGLKLPGDGVPPREYETEFRLRQKEEKTSTGSFVAREWSFAKLNTVTADKAPSLNPEFVRNVGTIEVVAMRCRPDTDIPVQRQSSSQPRNSGDAVVETSSKASKAASVKPGRSKAASNNAAQAAPAEDEGMLGGLFGIFDGACESFGMDGANDERPGLGLQTQQPAGGFTWDSVRGQYRQQDPVTPGMPGAYPKPAANINSDGRARAKAFVAQAAEEAQNAQVDGPGDWRNQYGMPLTGHRQDDLHGDRYLGMTGQDRSDYKQFFRERGDAVSQTPRPVIGIGMMEGFVCKSQAAAGKIKNAPEDSKESARFLAATQDEGYYENNAAGKHLLAADLEAFRRTLVEVEKNDPRADIAKAWQDWRLMEAKFNSMGAGQAATHPQLAPSSPLRPRQEASADIYGLRMKLRVAAQIYSGLDLDAWLADLDSFEAELRKDQLWADCDYPNEAAWLMTRRTQLSRRNQLLTKAIKDLARLDSKYDCSGVEQRIQEIRQEGMAAHARLKELGAIHGGGGQPHGPGKSTPKALIEFPQGFDGASWEQNGNDVAPAQQSFWNQATAGNGGDWQQVGDGSIKPGQHGGHGWSVSKPAGTHEHFGGQNINTTNNIWGGPDEQKWDASKPANDGGWKSHGASQQGGGQGWGTAQKPQSNGGWQRDQQRNSAWPDNKSASKGQSQAGWGDKGSNRGGSNGWGDGGGSHNQSQNNGGGGGWGNDHGGGNAWDANSKKSQSQNGGWGAAPGSNANRSSSSARNSGRLSTSAKPEDLVKPYWKNWDKRGDQCSLVSPAGRREVAREAYQYPAAKLPAIPEGKASGATHGVQTGRGAEYNHVCRRPVYIDTMEKPYAVFSFKYRSKDKLKKITGLNVKTVDEDVKVVQKQAQKDKLMQLPKDQLIEQLMKSSASKGGSQKAPSNNGAEGWGDKPASNANAWDQKSKAKSAAGGSEWGNQGNEQWNNNGGGGWGGSNHSKSKHSNAKGWGLNDQGAANWDGANDTPPGKPASESRPGSAAGKGFKGFDYDAFRSSAPAAPAEKNEWGQRDDDTSTFVSPDGIRFKGAEVVGYTSKPGSEDKRNRPVTGEREKGGSKDQGGRWEWGGSDAGGKQQGGGWVERPEEDGVVQW